MIELVKRQKYAGDVFDALVQKCGWDEDTAAAFLDRIPDAPTIDPEDLRPSGRWEKHRTMHGFVYCSNCKDVYLDEEWLVDGKWGFCPNCGAKMEDEK